MMFAKTIIVEAIHFSCTFLPFEVMLLQVRYIDTSDVVVAAAVRHCFSNNSGCLFIIVISKLSMYI